MTRADTDLQTSGAAAPSPFDVMTADLLTPTLLEASAGTGKTFSIKHLVLRLIVECDFPIDRILVVTFTRAATAELSSRIRQHLFEAAGYTAGTLGEEDVDGLVVRQVKSWLAAGFDQDDIGRRLRNSLSRFDSAAIYTIHSFCQKMLTAHAFSAQSAFDFEVAEDDGALRAEVIEDFLRRELDRASADAALPVKRLCEFDWDGLLKNLQAASSDLVPVRIEAEDDPAFETLLTRFVSEVPAALKKLKTKRRFWTFDDILASTWQTLRADRAGHFAKAVRRAYSGVLIDEFQDTDPLQFAIFERIFMDEPLTRESGHALFFVGDPKQAIYRFRSADLNTYLKAAARMPLRARLTRNFRSSPKLVAAVNDFFGVESETGAFLRADLPYIPVEASEKTGLYRRTPQGDWVEAPPMTLMMGENPFPDAKTIAACTAEGVANEIAALIEDGRAGLAAIAAGEDEADKICGEVQAGGRVIALRGVEARDIAILIRKRDDLDNVEKALLARGVRLRRRNDANVCHSSEAKEIMLILRAFASPSDERVMRAARATRFMGETLSSLRRTDDVVRTACRELFEDARRRWQKMGVAAAFANLMEKQRVTERILPTEGGEKRLTNYAHLIELLHEAGRNYSTPSALIAWFEKKMTTDDAAGDAFKERLSSDANLVTAETIHSSKGLQYPIVFLVHAEKLAKLRVDKACVFREFDPVEKRLFLRVLPGQTESSEDYLTADVEEEIRQAYVALTRAACAVYVSLALRAKSAKNLTDYHASGLKSAYLLALCGQRQINAGLFLGRIDALIEASGGAIRRTDIVQSAAGCRVLLPAAPAAAGEDGLASSPACDIASDWRVSSFTGITRMISDDGAENVRLFGERRPMTPSADIMTFPRGAKPGDTLHQIMEAADFPALAQTTPEADAARLALCRRVIEANLAFSSDAERDLAVRAAANMVTDVLNTEIIPGIRLATVTKKARVSEMPFLLSMAEGATAAGLGRLLEDYDPKYAVRGLSETTLKGFLTGFIDLAFGADGRFWILDWKSNAIPDHVKTPADFTQAVMSEEMARHHYRLQYLIYLAALRRFLRARLGAAYRDELIGGAVYVFLRGVRRDAVRTAEGMQGVVFDPVPADLIRKLDAYFAGEEFHD